MMPDKQSENQVWIR